MAKMKRPDVVEIYNAGGPQSDEGHGHPPNDYRWTRYSPNGRIIGASSEGYRSRKRCIENAKRCMTACEVKVVGNK